jgi:chemotaxis receptor (MCP) glutamine deamidase CheD
MPSEDERRKVRVVAADVLVVLSQLAADPGLAETEVLLSCVGAVVRECCLCC